jgi:ABC-type uncharacterized transport system ATPase subunit
MSSAVSMKGITKRFPLVLANDSVNFEVNSGEVHALIGENGAGKSTLVKILYGLQRADSGTIAINAKQVELQSAKEAIDLGVGMVHQHFMLVDSLTVVENLILGAEPVKGPSLDYTKARQNTKNLISRFGFDIDSDSRVDDLPLGLQQQVEILKALYREAQILILDEPTAVLTPQETKGLFSFLREFATQGNSVIFISHKLDEVMELCDRMSVMRDGRMIGTVNKSDTDQRELANMMVGREVILRVTKGPPSPKEIRLDLQSVTVSHPTKPRPVLDNVSFQLRAGEILGIAGIEGNGQSELVECITGLRPLKMGTVTLEGTDITTFSARERRERGLSHVPENRNVRGLVGSYSSAMNSILGDHYRKPYSGFLGMLQMPAIEHHAETLVKTYDVRPPSISLAADSFSGGNAQKLVLARELERDTSVLVLAQPTRGVDIGAIEFIHRQIVKARNNGLAVLLISADLNEVMSLSDRILVMYEGQIMGEITNELATAEKLGLLMAGSNLSLD